MTASIREAWTSDFPAICVTFDWLPSVHEFEVG